VPACKRNPRFRVQRLERRVEWASRRDRRLYPTKAELQDCAYCTNGLITPEGDCGMNKAAVRAASAAILIKTGNESRAGHGNVLQKGVHDGCIGSTSWFGILPHSDRKDGTYP
jgi:hypothetical protein